LVCLTECRTQVVENDGAAISNVGYSRLLASQRVPLADNVECSRRSRLLASGVALAGNIGCDCSRLLASQGMSLAGNIGCDCSRLLASQGMSLVGNIKGGFFNGANIAGCSCCSGSTAVSSHSGTIANFMDALGPTYLSHSSNSVPCHHLGSRPRQLRLPKYRISTRNGCDVDAFSSTIRIANSSDQIRRLVKDRTSILSPYIIAHMVDRFVKQQLRE
jgi:hypothetical protein